MTVATPSQDSERTRRRLGTIADVLAIIPLARNSIYDSARLGRLPGVVKIGRRVLFDMDEIDRWLDSGGERAQ